MMELMTDLLENALARIEQLPEGDQDAIAAQILAELTDEELWAARRRALAEHRAGVTRPIRRHPVIACRTTKLFRRQLAVLPAAVQQMAREAYLRFRANPSHPSLHFKKLARHENLYSERIGSGYRCWGFHGIANRGLSSGSDPHADYDGWV